MFLFYKMCKYQNPPGTPHKPPGTPHNPPGGEMGSVLLGRLVVLLLASCSKEYSRVVSETLVSMSCCIVGSRLLAAPFAFSLFREAGCRGGGRRGDGGHGDGGGGGRGGGGGGRTCQLWLELSCIELIPLHLRCLHVSVTFNSLMLPELARCFHMI